MQSDERVPLVLSIKKYSYDRLEKLAQVQSVSVEELICDAIDNLIEGHSDLIDNGARE
jgi:hypothetical protein